MKHLVILAILAILSACSTSGKQANTVTLENVDQWPPPVGEVVLLLAQQPADNTRLDLGLIVFDPGIPEDESTHSALEIFPKIRDVEAQFLPVVLRQALVASNNWGVVRVVPEDDSTLELRVTGEILHSDGIDLVLQIKAYDATGRVWLDRIYHDQTSQSDYPAIARDDPYGDIYRKISNDLGEIKAQFNAEQMAAIRNVALLRYAASLSPEAFSDFLTENAEGQLELQRLPAEDDPMMLRVERIRNQEYLFIDTVDEQYVELHAEMGPTYYLWRQYGRERAIFKDVYGERAANRDSYGRRGSYIAMEQSYNAFKNSKIQDQDLQELAGGFNNEVAPTVMEVSGRVFRLSGGLDAQYTEWREILRSIFSLETGLPMLEK